MAKELSVLRNHDDRADAKSSRYIKQWGRATSRAALWRKSTGDKADAMREAMPR